jgi:hypothetical protein
VQSKTTTKKSSPGRPPGRQPRPHIQVPGDELWPLPDLAVDFGISTRTLRRNPDVAITYVGNVAYAKNIATRKVFADSVKTPKQRRGRRR